MEHIAIKNPDITCCKCLKETNDIIKIHIGQMGYGSGFDGWSTQVNLCSDCYNSTNTEWWKLEEISCDFDPENFTEYKYENEIFAFFKALPIEGRELIYNRYPSGWNADHILEPQDYIDYGLGILSHEKCKEYGMYSHQEINAYKERFPICQHPVNKIYSDDSKGCWCPFGANGAYGQKCGLNISQDCYECSYFIERTTPIKDISDNDYNHYKIYYIAKINADKYKEKFE
jgi:hypothetical protein